VAAYCAAAHRLAARGVYPSLRTLVAESGLSIDFVLDQRRRERKARCPRCQMLYGEERCGRGRLRASDGDVL